jgi:hypothetical protein
MTWIYRNLTRALRATHCHRKPHPWNFALPRDTVKTSLPHDFFTWSFSPELRTPCVELATSNTASTMTDHELCGPCLVFVSRDEVLSKTGTYPHHNGAGSFRRALELPCAICIQLPSQFQRGQGDDGFDETFQLGSTSYTVTRGRSHSTVRFSCGNRAFQLKFENRKGKSVCGPSETPTLMIHRNRLANHV